MTLTVTLWPIFVTTWHSRQPSLGLTVPAERRQIFTLVFNFGIQLWYSNSLGIASQDKLWLTANSQVLSRYLRRTNSDNIIVHLWVVFIHAEEKLDTRDIHSSYKIMFNVSILNDLFCSFLLLFTRGFKWVEDKRVVFSVYAHLLLQLK